MGLLRERILRLSNIRPIEMAVSHLQEEAMERILIIKQITTQVLWKTVDVTLRNLGSILRVSSIR
jgi:hypothetical protein